jgi:hypothetical protein
MKINVFDINKDISFSTSSEPIQPLQPLQPVNHSNFTNTIKIRTPLT